MLDSAFPFIHNGFDSGDLTPNLAKPIRPGSLAGAILHAQIELLSPQCQQLIA